MIYTLDGIAPEVHPSAWIAPTAVLIGRVKVGAGASVWFGAVLRGDGEPIEIGDGANVQENSVLHTDTGFPLTVGAGATIGHRVMLHGCTIGAHALVGMSATVLNGAHLGEESLLGAAALLTEGKQVPAGHLAVGAPARVVRALGADEIAALHASGTHYRENGERFASGLQLQG